MVHFRDDTYSVIKEHFVYIMYTIQDENQPSDVQSGYNFIDCDCVRIVYVINRLSFVTIWMISSTCPVLCTLCIRTLTNRIHPINNNVNTYTV